MAGQVACLFGECRSARLQSLGGRLARDAVDLLWAPSGRWPRAPRRDRGCKGGTRSQLASHEMWRRAPSRSYSPGCGWSLGGGGKAQRRQREPELAGSTYAPKTTKGPRTRPTMLPCCCCCSHSQVPTGLSNSLFGSLLPPSSPDGMVKPPRVCPYACPFLSCFLFSLWGRGSSLGGPFLSPPSPWGCGAPLGELRSWARALAFEAVSGRGGAGGGAVLHPCGVGPPLPPDRSQTLAGACG